MARFDITVFFATNRNRLRGKDDFGPDFASHPTLFRVGCAKVTVDVSVTRDGVKGKGANIQSLEVYDERKAADGTGFAAVGTDRLFPELSSLMSEEGRDALCFIPGFNYSFKDSIERAAFLAALYSKDNASALVAFVFSWPSDSKLSLNAYLSDRMDAELSGPAIARAAARLTDLYVKLVRGQGDRLDCGQRLHLVAHSMGAHALKHAVMAFNRLPGARLVRIFETAIIAGGDTERDALELPEKMAPLARLAKQVHCYINAKDKPLELSDEVVEPRDRLGSYGPLDPTVTETFGVPLSIVDCRNADFPGQDATRHQYYRVSPRVIRDIVEVMEGRDEGNFTHRWFDEKRGVIRLDDRPKS